MELDRFQRYDKLLGRRERLRLAVKYSFFCALISFFVSVATFEFVRKVSEFQQIVFIVSFFLTLIAAVIFVSSLILSFTVSLKLNSWKPD
jgi:hypothetical protein